MAGSDYNLVSVDKISQKDFYNDFVGKQRPIHLKSFIADWTACEKWTPHYLAGFGENLSIRIKKYTYGNFLCAYDTTLKAYALYLEQCSSGLIDTSKEILYCHDIPIFHLIPHLLFDIGNQHCQYLPAWYRKTWWKYVQFFMGPEKSLTPLHFDCLLTNNLFFQIHGKKKFIIYDYQDAQYCGRYGWRWFNINPENPDLIKFPSYIKTNPIEVILHPGDVLYLPPGTLHMVRSMDTSISFNIDFHTSSSSLKGLVAIFNGMPITNVYYNFLCTLGLVCKVPEQIIFPLYKSYLNYIS